MLPVDRHRENTVTWRRWDHVPIESFAWRPRVDGLTIEQAHYNLGRKDRE